jgi:hypothetical protein
MPVPVSPACFDARSNCSQAICDNAEAQRYCARTCGTCAPLIAPVQLSVLHGGFLPIPESASHVFVEIGSSDRNTMDVEVLPRLPSAYLVTAEPLIEKYARALNRRADASTVADATEPLGRHHDRGIILPFAVAPMLQRTQPNGTMLENPQGPAEGELRGLNIGGNAGCASLSQVNRSRHAKSGATSFGAWCDTVGRGVYAKDSRHVWTVPLRQILRWIGRPVDFVKIDAREEHAGIRSPGLPCALFDIKPTFESRWLQRGWTLR